MTHGRRWSTVIINGANILVTAAYSGGVNRDSGYVILLRLSTGVGVAGANSVNRNVDATSESSRGVLHVRYTPSPHRPTIRLRQHVPRGTWRQAMA